MKNIYRNVAFSGLGYLLPILVSLATIPMMLRFMGADIYGLYIICVSLIGFIAFADLGVGQAVIKYISQYEATGERAKVKPFLEVARTFYVVLGLLIAALLAVFSNELGGWLRQGKPDSQVDVALAGQALAITALAFLFGYLNQFYLNVFRAYHRFDIPAVIHNAANVVGILQAVVLLLLGHGLLAILWGYVAVQAIALLSGYLLARHLLSIGGGLRFSLGYQVLKEILGFSSYTFVSNFLGGVVFRLDKLFIGVLLGTEAVAYYQIPHTIAQMANGVIQVLSQITFPRFSELSSLQQQEQRLVLYKQALLLVFIVGAVINLGLISAGGAFLSIWISPEFAERSTLTLQIVALYSFFQSNTMIPYWVLQGEGKAKVAALSSLVGTVCYFIGLYLLTPVYGYNGAALSLFLLLLPLPYFYYWVRQGVGHRFRDYLLLNALFLLVGALLFIGLSRLYHYIGSDIWFVVLDALLLLGALAAALYFAMGWIGRSNRGNQYGSG